MNAPIWLIEADVYGPEVEPLVAEVRRQGMDGRFVTYREIVKGPAPVAPGSCVIVYGTYPTIRHAMLRCGWTPGGWCSPENLDCATYYPHFTGLLLNQRHEILPGSDAIREKRRLFDEFARDGKVFARPTSVHKLFVGRLIAEVDFETALAPTRYDPETRVVIAEPREVWREWRLVVAGDEVIAGSQYAEDGERLIKPNCPEKVRDFGRALLADGRWRPDGMFMMDVCEADDGLRLVELNSFSCSWLYDCDFAAVVQSASQLAVQSWERTQS